MPQNDEALLEPVTVERELLRTRAERYARRDTRRDVASHDVLVFTRGASSYAIGLATLREVRPWPKLCVIPGASPAVPGVFHYRGELLSAHDLSRFMGLTAASAPQWVLVLEHGGERIGLMADEVVGIRAVPEDEVQPVPVTFGEHGGCFIGVADGALLLLDSAQLFSAQAFFSAF